MSSGQLWSALDKLDAVKDTLTVGRVFGDAYEVGGTTIIPVASVRGGGGGGGGEAPTDGGVSTGGGVGFGVKALNVRLLVPPPGDGFVILIVCEPTVNGPLDTDTTVDPINV